MGLFPIAPIFYPQNFKIFFCLNIFLKICWWKPPPGAWWKAESGHRHLGLTQWRGRKTLMVGSQWWAARWVPKFSLKKWGVVLHVLKIQVSWWFQSIKRVPTSWTRTCRKVFVCAMLVDMTRHFSTRHEGVFLDARGGPPVPLRYLCSDANTMGLIWDDLSN